MNRPLPPAEIADDLRLPEQFAPAVGLDAWAREAFLDQASPLYNPDHAHLETARIGWLWTNVLNEKRPKLVAGTAEMPNPKGPRWAVARQRYQLVSWFRCEPDFVVTLDAVIAAELDDLSWCALVEHELYHCGQALDEWGMPRFKRDTGEPVFAVRPHDVEAFVPITARYGVAGAESGVAQLVRAAQRAPLIGRAAVDAACGTCGLKVA